MSIISVVLKHAPSRLPFVEGFFRVAGSILIACSSASAFAQSFTENFDNITLLTGNDWFMQNNSNPPGSTGWFQGYPASAVPNPGPFNAYNGADNAYIAANFQNTSAMNDGTISNFLLTPNRTLRNGDVFQFYTRKPTVGPGFDFPDRLEVRMSTNGSSTNVGPGVLGVGDFTTLLLSINPDLVVGVYPQVWTQFTITISGLTAPTSGRLAFRYFVPFAGSNGRNSDYIGIDNVVYTAYVCPALTISPNTLPGASFGQLYSQSF
ncbi:choice-of-anchor J domain-containing protein, partial [Dokdonella sp.]|uniref:choice-of-anchor J domain-containing protein n=1 Tax=Dokdonella sp. TaxID=2291710 RepID=UPI003C48C5A9